MIPVESRRSNLQLHTLLTSVPRGFIVFRLSVQRYLQGWGACIQIADFQFKLLADIRVSSCRCPTHWWTRNRACIEVMLESETVRVSMIATIDHNCLTVSTW